MTLQSTIGLTDQRDLHVFTTEELAAYQFKKLLTLSASVKWNKLNRDENLFGGTASMNIYLKKLGTIQLTYDKTFLPGYDRVLIPVDIGRMSFFREF